MSLPVGRMSPRLTQLRLRCEVQREELAEAFAEIEQRFQSVDSMLMSAKNVVAKPSFVMGSLAVLALGRRRLKLFSKLRKGLFWIATGRKLYRMFRGR